MNDNKKNSGKLKLGFLIVGILIIFIFVTSFVSAANIGISPAKINFENVIRNGYAERTIVVSADTDEAIKISVTPRDEIAEWLNFSDNNFSVSRDEPFYLRVSVTPPIDIPNGNYTGFLRFMAQGQGDSIEGHAVGQVLTSLDLAIGVEVTDVEVIDCKVSGFQIFSVEEGDDIILKMKILNEGNVRINPTVIMDVWDFDQIQIVGTEEFSGEEVLPTVENEFEFRASSDNFDLGQYWAEISVLECVQSTTLTFDVLEEGALTARGEILGILTEKEVAVGDTTPILINFKNSGEKEVEAQFKGKVTSDGRIVDILESEKILVPVSGIEGFTFYLTPEKAGRYVISGRVFYESKKTFESSAILEAVSKGVFSYPLLLPLIYLGFFVLIGILFYKIRKERSIYQRRLRNLK